MKRYISILALSMVLTSTFSAHAQSTGGSGPSTGGSGSPQIKVTIDNPFNCGDNCTIQGLLRAIIDGILIPVGAVAAVLGFIWSGFLFVTAQGKPDKLETAKRALLYTAVGTAVLLGAWVISEVITGTVNALRP